MAAAKTGVRIYQRIRRYIDKIYLYGFLSRRDFARLNHGSAKDYDVSVKLIKELFSDDGFNQKRGVQSVSRDYHTSGDLHLPDSYLLCQLDLQDMAEYLHYLNIARQGPAVAPHFHDLLQLQPIPGHCVGTAYNRLDHLCSYGCMQLKENQYALLPDGLDALRDTQLQQLYDYVRFCARTTFPRVAAGALQRTLACRLAERGILTREELPFLFRQNSNFHVLDEELVYTLGDLMRARRWAYFDDRLLLPLILRVDTQMGRWYALCADKNGSAVIERLANVENLAPAEESETPQAWEYLRRKVATAYRHRLFSGHRGKPVKVCAKLEFSENPSLRNQLLREIRIGRIVRRENEEYYEAVVSDPGELKPLLRAYGPYLQILPGKHDLAADLRDHYERMLEALEEETV